MFITHVIFDFDGILVDTERLYSKANEHVLKKYYGKTFTNKQLGF
jgi:beta-phosphoglucomutase-like phosphatase (HAD superfamily)